VRIVVTVTLLLLAIGWVGCAVPTGGESAPRTADDGWRRTAQGWQRASQWPQPLPASGAIPAGGAALTLVVAQLTASVAALAAFPSGGSRRTRRPVAPPRPATRTDRRRAGDLASSG